MELNCNYCNKIFNKRKSYINRLNFCSKECHYRFRSEFTEIYYNGKHPSYKSRNTYKCANCNKEISVLESQMKRNKNILCSKQCRFEFDSKKYSGSGNPNYQNKGQKNNCLNCNNVYVAYGKHKEYSKYCCAKCRDEHLKNTLYKTEKWKSMLVQNGINSMRKSKNKFTKPERMVMDFLYTNNIEFIPQCIMYNRFCVDFYIPLKNIIIEVLGDYWHGHPDRYSSEKLTEKQKRHQNRDKIKQTFFTQEGYIIYMVWECDIYKDIENSLNFLK